MVYRKFILRLAATIGTLTLGTALNAQIVSYDMTGNSGITTEQNVSLKNVNVTASTLTRTDLSAASGTDLFVSSAWNTTNALLLNIDYIGFSLAPTGGYSANLTQLSFKVNGSPAAPANLVVAYSTDGFSTSAQSSPYSITTSLVNNTWDFNDFGVTAGTSVVFRFFAFGATSVSGGTSTNSGTVRFDDIVLSGSVTAIPELSTGAVCVGLAALCTVFFRSVRRRDVKSANTRAPRP